MFIAITDDVTSKKDIAVNLDQVTYYHYPTRQIFMSDGKSFRLNEAENKKLCGKLIELGIAK